MISFFLTQVMRGFGPKLSFSLLSLGVVFFALGICVIVYPAIVKAMISLMMMMFGGCLIGVGLRIRQIRKHIPENINIFESRH